MCDDIIVKLLDFEKRFSFTSPRTVRRSGILIINFEQISHTVLVFSLLSFNKEIPVRLSSRIHTDPSHFEAIANFRAKCEYGKILFLSRHRT